MTPREALERVLDDLHTDAIIAHRKAMRKPLTPHAAELLAREFAKCQSPNDAADQMMLMGWQGFKAEWLAPHGGNVVPLRAGDGYQQSVRRLMAR